jgi:ABC-type branched-subunit amino acid transport system substrate-binding protein
MRKRLSLLVLVLVIAMVGAACSSDDSGDTTTTAGGTDETTTTTSGGTEETTTTAGETPAEIKTDIGVDAENKVIKLGLLADLTGLFAATVTDITDATSVYWDQVNANGGLADGWTVELVIEDTNYNVEQHMEKYEKLKDEVVAITQSTGSPTSITMLPEAIADDLVFTPLSWYSGWAIPEFDNGNALELNSNYCLEAMNLVHFMHDMGGQTIAIATFPSDYGFDAGAGVKSAAEYYGMEIVYDGDGAVIPGQDQTPVIQGIVGSGADWTFLTTNPSIGAEILAGAVQSGYTGMFTGSVPTYDFRLLDSAAGPLYDAVYYQSSWGNLWGESSPGYDDMLAALQAAFPDRRPSDSFLLGWQESIAWQAVLEAAIASGDLTRAGVKAAANSLETVDFGGMAPNQSYAGTPNEYVTRQTAVYDPDLATYTAAGGADQTLSQEGSSTGSLPVTGWFVGDATADYDFTAPCYSLG